MLSIEQICLAISTTILFKIQITTTLYDIVYTNDFLLPIQTSNLVFPCNFRESGHVRIDRQSIRQTAFMNSRF